MDIDPLERSGRVAGTLRIVSPPKRLSERKLPLFMALPPETVRRSAGAAIPSTVRVSLVANAKQEQAMYRCRRSHINPLFAYLFCSQPNFSHTDTASERIASKSLENGVVRNRVTRRCRIQKIQKGSLWGAGLVTVWVAATCRRICRLNSQPEVAQAAAGKSADRLTHSEERLVSE